MARAFVLNEPYPTAQFSTLYLFGRGQDIGFQRAAERGYIVNELRKSGAIENVAFYKTGDKLPTKHVNHYITDGEIAIAELKGTSRRSRPL
jgi:hypothetical protein